VTRADAVRILELALQGFAATHRLPDAATGAVGADVEAVRWAAEARAGLRRFQQPQVTPLALGDGVGGGRYVH
jgi:hypothetical protein